MKGSALLKTLWEPGGGTEDSERKLLQEPRETSSENASANKTEFRTSAFWPILINHHVPRD